MREVWLISSLTFLTRLCKALRGSGPSFSSIVLKSTVSPFAILSNNADAVDVSLAAWIAWLSTTVVGNFKFIFNSFSDISSLINSLYKIYVGGIFPPFRRWA